MNFGTGAATTIGEAAFTGVSATGTGSPAGVSISGFNTNATWIGGNNLGSTPAADALESIFSTIMFSSSATTGTGKIDLNVSAGENYRLHLLLSEGRAPLAADFRRPVLPARHRKCRA